MADSSGSSPDIAGQAGLLGILSLPFVSGALTFFSSAYAGQQSEDMTGWLRELIPVMGSIVVASITGYFALRAKTEKPKPLENEFAFEALKTAFEQMESYNSKLEDEVRLLEDKLRYAQQHLSLLETERHEQ